MAQIISLMVFHNSYGQPTLASSVQKLKENANTVVNAKFIFYNKHKGWQVYVK